MATAAHERQAAGAEPRGTALALILATERLVAEHGSAGVSLRQIAQDAGAANVSAVQYHFGSREALLLAVLQYRMTAINARRLERLARLEAAGELLDQRGLVGSLVYPLTAELERRPGGNHYLRFLERRTREGISGAEMLDSLLTGWVRTEKLLRETIAELPAAIAEFRITLMRDQAISGMAAIEAGLGKRSARREIALQIELLIDAAVATLGGPVSPETMGVLNGAAAA